MIVRWQIRGAAMAMVLIALIMQPFGYWMVIRILQCKPAPFCGRSGFR